MAQSILIIPYDLSVIDRYTHFLRSMSQTMNIVMLLHTHKDKVDNIELTDTAKQFVECCILCAPPPPPPPQF